MGLIERSAYFMEMRVLGGIYLGYIVFHDGLESEPVLSKDFALQLAQAACDSGMISTEEKTAVDEQIRNSNLADSVHVLNVVRGQPVSEEGSGAEFGKPMLRRPRRVDLN